MPAYESIPRSVQACRLNSEADIPKLVRIAQLDTDYITVAVKPPFEDPHTGTFDYLMLYCTWESGRYFNLDGSRSPSMPFTGAYFVPKGSYLVYDPKNPARLTNQAIQPVHVLDAEEFVKLYRVKPRNWFHVERRKALLTAGWAAYLAFIGTVLYLLFWRD